MKQKLAFKVMAFLIALNSAVIASQWETPLQVSQAASLSTMPPIIVADFEDNAAMVWIQGGEVYTSYRPVAGSWETPTNHGKGNEYQLCMDEAGNVTLAFLQGTSNTQILTGFRPYGAGWTTTAQSVGEATDTASDLSLTCTSTNFYAYISWFDSTAPTPRVYTLFRSGSGTGWAGAPTNVNTGVNAADSNSKAIVKVLSDGNATVVGKFTSPTADYYYSTTTTPGGSWPSLTALAFPSLISTDTFDFDMQPNGNAVVAGTGGTTLRITSTSNPSSWPGAPYNTTITGTSTPSVGVDSNGLASVAWIVSSTTMQIAHDTVGGTTWSPITLTSGGVLSRPKIDVSSNGFRVVAWNDGSGSPSKLVALRGQNTELETTSSVVDAEMELNTLNVYVSPTSRGFAAWNDSVTNNFAEASRTFDGTSSDPTTNLLRALGKKRLIYQPTRYP